MFFNLNAKLVSCFILLFYKAIRLLKIYISCFNYNNQ